MLSTMEHIDSDSNCMFISYSQCMSFVAAMIIEYSDIPPWGCTTGVSQPRGEHTVEL